jgi:hypothetical protein
VSLGYDTKLVHDQITITPFGRYRIWSRDQLHVISQWHSKNESYFLKDNYILLHLQFCSLYFFQLILLVFSEYNSHSVIYRLVPCSVQYQIHCDELFSFLPKSCSCCHAFQARNQYYTTIIVYPSPLNKLQANCYKRY